MQQPVMHKAEHLLTTDGWEFGSSVDSFAGRRVPPGRPSKVAQESLRTLKIHTMVTLALGRALCKTYVCVSFPSYGRAS